MKKNTLLWRIEDDGQLAPSYVFGTMHIKDQRAFGFKDIVHEKINECVAFATEFNLEEAQLNFSATAMDLPAGTTLSDLIPPKIYQKINQIFVKTVGLDLDLFNNNQPILITNLITERILSSDMPLSLDESLWRYAKSQNKVTLGIETYEEQLEILGKIPLDYQVKSLIWIGKNFKRYRKQLQKMTDLYESADLQKLYKAAKKSVRGLRKILLYDRNVVMAERIAFMAREQSILCAVGAGHLSGKKGVLRLLKRHGFKVKPVSLKNCVFIIPRWKLIVL